jgi:hypothetical protein
MIEVAFAEICKEAVECVQGFYVVLWREEPFYGGPEEGGWWGRNLIPVAYQRFATSDAAHAASNAVRKLAAEMTADAQREHGRACLAQLEFCEERGIDDSDSVFGEDDGPESYYVTVDDKLPEPMFGSRHYE